MTNRIRNACAPWPFQAHRGCGSIGTRFGAMADKEDHDQDVSDSESSTTADESEDCDYQPFVDAFMSGSKKLTQARLSTTPSKHMVQ